MECMILTILISTHSLTRRLTNTTYTSQIYMTISTHSLTRRLTILYSISNTLFHISTHSLTRRLTMRQLTQALPLCYFNSQPHKEADWRFLRPYIS